MKIPGEIVLQPIKKWHRAIKRDWRNVDYYEPLTGKISSYIPDYWMEFVDLCDDFANELIDELREMPEAPIHSILRRNGYFNIRYNPRDHRVYVGHGSNYFMAITYGNDSETNQRITCTEVYLPRGV